MPSLVIVESPAKAKTISRILGSKYVVEASYGHVRDLPERADEIPAKLKKEPWARLGVNVDKDFEPLYVVPDDKKRHVGRLKEAMKKADELLLATDEDREGESISWHVVQVLQPKIPVHRVAFHEITPEAVREAVAHPREVDKNLVRAQESRRILDRLYGYTLSPVLWKKVRRGLSAGRVQSVAVRLCVIRERERQAFRAAGYWDAEAIFTTGGSTFAAKLARVGSRRIASGQDFEQTTGQLKEGADVVWLSDAPDVRTLVDAMQRPFTVTKIDEKPITQRPAPPFMTSSLQQEANRKLGFAARHTMRIAQRLYEGIDLDGERVGLITYMRTDSMTLSERALAEAETVIRDMYGQDYTSGPRRYKTKSKNAQEAHEAIRPTELARTPESLSRYLDRDGLRLYELIWKRTIASQMTEAQILRTSVEISASFGGAAPVRVAGNGTKEVDGDAVFTASGKIVKFPGYLRAYVEGSDDPEAEIADREVILPELRIGQKLDPTKIEAKGHETQPPARYTEASLVKELEAEGIGRPSTYATIIDTIQARGYVVTQSKALVPTVTAFCVNQLLEKHFSEYVDIKFTARLEQELDDISTGELDWREHLEHFYRGNGKREPGLEARVKIEEPRIEYPALMLGKHPKTGEPVVAKVGRYGPYVQIGSNGENGDRLIASLPTDIAPADLSLEEALTLIQKKQDGPRVVGQDPDTGQPIYVLSGRFGPYVQVGENPKDRKGPKPRRASMPKEFTEATITLPDALKLLSLPRVLGTHPTSGEEIVAAKGRFGAYIKCGAETRSIRGRKDLDVYTIALGEALKLLAEPKVTRGRRTTRTVLKDLGKDKAGKPIHVLDGPYGPYVTNGEVNASLPEGIGPDDFTLEDAVDHLARNGKAPRRKARTSA
jgi:DNA topoisomerase-1